MPAGCVMPGGVNPGAGLRSIVAAALYRPHPGVGIGDNGAIFPGAAPGDFRHRHNPAAIDAAAAVIGRENDVLLRSMQNQIRRFAQAEGLVPEEAA